MKTACLILAAACCLAQEPGFFEAAARGDVARLRALVEQGADVNARDIRQWTALHHAATKCQFASVQFLVMHHADRFARDAEGRTPGALPRNCPTGNEGLGNGIVIGLWLAPGASAGQPPMQDIPWSLHYAAAHGQAGLVAMLIKMGGNVDAPNSDGDRPVDIAALHGDAATVRALLDAGASPKLENGAGATPLHYAALSGNRRVIELLLDHGADVDARDVESGATALHRAASFGRPDAARTLIAGGADRRLRNNKGKTALELARDNNFEEIIALLRD